MLKAAILITVISASAICVGQPEINLGQNLYAFSGEPNARRQVDDSLLFDSDNNRIANACINGAHRSELTRLKIPDLDSRLQKMQTGNLLSSEHGAYVLTIPVLAGKDRSKLSDRVSRPAKRRFGAALAWLACRDAEIHKLMLEVQHLLKPRSVLRSPEIPALIQTEVN